MLYASTQGGLEIRTEGDGTAVIAGRFPYGAETELAPHRREVFQPGAFRVDNDVHLLSQHNYASPLASRASGSLTVTGDDDALSFEARIAPEVANTSHGGDALAMIRAGLAIGLSPGFVVPADGSTVERRGDDIVRTVSKAELHELSIVTKAAYSTAQVEARSWTPERITQGFVCIPAWRWR